MSSNRQPVDILAAFDIGSSQPRPLRFKLFENGIKKTVAISDITDITTLGAGGMSRIEYTCRSNGNSGVIEYKLLYFYRVNRWEIER